MEENQIITVDEIRRKVYFIRGQQVMLDQDLAEIYGYEVKRLNEQVKRNISRFPEDFMFQLEKDELPLALKSQFATLNESGNKRGLHMKKYPYAFTEQGIYMLATVLRGELAEQQSIFIMRAFREMRHYIKQNQQFVTQSEMKLLSARVTELAVQTAAIGDRQAKSERERIRSDKELRAEIQDIQKKIDMISENFISEKDLINFVIYKDQKFEADAAYIDIFRQADKTIYIIDDYMNIKTLQLLSHKKVGIDVILFTENGHGRRGYLSMAEVTDFDQQYPSLRIKGNPDCHDRFVVLDYGLPMEQVYHCGASSKDAGKKVCAINRIVKTEMIHPVMDALLKLPDKTL